MKKGVNQRVFDVPACGAFLLTDYREALFELFEPEREAVCWREPKEAADMARYFLRHDSLRRRIAATARQKVLAEHTYAHRLETLVTQVRKDYLS